MPILSSSGNQMVFNNFPQNKIVCPHSRGKVAAHENEENTKILRTDAVLILLWAYNFL